MVTADSDPATCGCSTYWIDVEIWCTAIGPNPSAPFPPAGVGNYVALNGPNFYTSAEMQKPNCVLQTYPWTTISFAQLCPGITYNYRMREHHNSLLGPWTQTFTFTVPGTPPAFSVNPASNPNIVCPGSCANLSANFTGTGGCNSFQYTWVPNSNLSIPNYVSTQSYGPQGPTPIYVRYNNVTYMYVGSTAQTGVTPGSNTAYWQTATIAANNIPNPVACPAATTTYTLTVQEACTGSIQAGMLVVEVLPPPVAGTASISNSFICANTCTNLSLTGYTGSIQWQVGTSSSGPWTNIAGATTTPYQLCPTNNGTYYYRAVVSGCQNLTANSNFVTLTVNPAPNVVIANNHIDICVGGSTPVTASGAAIYTWNPGGTSGNNINVSPTATSTYTVTGTTSGCRDTAIAIVRVNPLPNVDAGPDLSTCQGVPINVSVTGAVSYVWSPGTGLSSTTGSTVTANPPSTTTYTITGSSGTNCIDYDTIVVNILPPPIADAGPDLLTCVGTPVTITAQGGTTYSWSPGTGLSSTTGNSVQATPTTTTTYTVTAFIGSCTSTDQMVVQITPMPVANAGADASICSGTTIPLSGSGGTTYEWSPASSLTPLTGIGQTVQATPMTTTTYTLTAANGACTSTDEVLVTVSPAPTVDAGPDAFICISQGATLNATGATSYTWGPSTGLSATSGPTVTASPTSTTTYTVTGTMNGCMSADTVIVNVQTAIAVTASADQTMCFGSMVQMSVTGATTYEWSPNTAISSVTDSLVTAGPAATTTYTVTGSNNGCSGTDQVVVTVLPLPNVNAGADVSLCEGSQAQLSASGAATYLWSPALGLSDPAIANPVASPTSTTTYTLTGTSAAGCVNYDTMIVTVHPLPIPDFSVQDTCFYLPLNFTDNSTISSGAIATWFWNFGDGTNSADQNPTHSYGAPGTYPVVLVVQSNTSPSCVGVVNKNVTVYPKPVAAITGTNECIGVATTFTNNSTVSSGSIMTNTWSFGDSNGSSQQSPTHTYGASGTYMVELIVSSDHNCLDTATTTVMVHPKPVASFTNTTVCFGFTTDFTSTSTVSIGSIQTETWDFGDASIGAGNTTSHTFAASGNYNVELLVTSDNGCQDSITQSVQVYDKPVADFSSSPVCLGNLTTFSDLSMVSSPATVDTWSWDFGNGEVSNSGTPTVTYAADGSYTVTLIVTTNQNCKDTVYNQAIVHPIPIVQISSDIVSGCNPVCIKFSDATTVTTGSTTTWNWNYGNGLVGNTKNPEFCFENAGDYPVVLTATTNNGCTGTSAPYIVTSYAVPIAEFTLSPERASIVNPTVVYTDKSQVADNWIWNFGDSTITMFNVLTDRIEHTYGDTGTYCTELKVSNVYGCRDSIEHCVIIDPDFVIYIPNAFTPNGDGKNDLFLPFGTGISENKFEMKIYDRWGSLTYSTKDITKGWNGKFNNIGDEAPEDTYVYVITFYDINEVPAPRYRNGKVTLIR